ncbi:MAG: type II secretion system F family protein [Candidatus Limivivens sp.]|nr:type II secretion system F family protein [Candidatus Limivivens sp.]
MEKKLTNEELSRFFQQLSMILKSGISSLEGIMIMEEDAASDAGRAILSKIREPLETGESLFHSLESSSVFPGYALHMVRIGEETGRLDTVTDSLSVYYERQDAVRKEIKSALAYPLIMLGIMTVIILVLVIRVLPVFNQVYRELGSEMTGFPRAVMNAGTLLGQFAVPILIVLALLGVLAGFLIREKKLPLPMLKNLSHSLSAGRLADGLSMALASGLDMEESLKLAGQLVEDPDMQEKVRLCLQNVSEGMDFCQALSQNAIFSGVYARMISVGFRTGSTDEILRKVAEQYQEETSRRIGRMISWLEPAMVAILSVIVGAILLSVMLPLLGIMSGIGTF